MVRLFKCRSCFSNNTLLCCSNQKVKVCKKTDMSTILHTIICLRQQQVENRNRPIFIEKGMYRSLKTSLYDVNITTNIFGHILLFKTPHPQLPINISIIFVAHNRVCESIQDSLFDWKYRLCIHMTHISLKPF